MSKIIGFIVYYIALVVVMIQILGLIKWLVVPLTPLNYALIAIAAFVIALFSDWGEEDNND